MGYMHISNLYQAQQILQFRTCFALEKIHGTSAHIVYRDSTVDVFPGGESYQRFVGLFDLGALQAAFAGKFTAEDLVIVYGEAYGGKQQGMSETYGKELRFVAFEVLVNGTFLNVPNAAELATSLGFEFVHYEETSTDIGALNALRDARSVQAERNGIAEPKMREGIVLRPPFEVVMSNGGRIMAKHKRAEFSERATPKLDEVSPEKRAVLDAAESVAEEWVTPMRLTHVIDRMLAGRDDKEASPRDTRDLIALMVEDVTREAAGEITDSREVRKAIGSRTAALFKKRLEEVLANG